MPLNITAEARKADFVSQFGERWQSLIDIMGISRPIKKMPGSTLASYTTSVELASGTVEKGGVIPDSTVTYTEANKADVVFKKFKRKVPIEDVDKYGAEIAIQRTDKAFATKLSSEILSDFYTTLSAGTLTDTQDSFQMGVAMAIGKVKDKFAKINLDADEVVVFVNILDAYEYLGASEITTQNVMGLQYIEGFMGADKMFLAPNVARGKVIATPTNNIVLYYSDPADSDFAKLGLQYTTVDDEQTKLVGFAVDGDYDTASGTTYAIHAMKLWAEFEDGIAVMTVTPAV